MKVEFKCMVLALAASMCGASGMAQDMQVTGGDTLKLSLDDCIRIAVNENPSVKVADMELEKVDYSKKETLGQLLPTVDFSGTYGRTLAKQTMSMNFGGQSQSIKVGTDNSYNVGFSATVPLIAPQLWASLKLSDTQILQNIEAARANRLSLVNQVQKAYYAWLLAKDSYNVLLDNKATAELNAEIYRNKFKIGTASEFDVLRAEVQIKNLEPSILEAENSIRQCALQLKLLMGMSMDVNITPSTQLEVFKGDMYENTMSLNPTLEQNTDLKTLDLQTQSLEQALKVQKMAWYPTLGASINYNWTSMNDGTPFKDLKWNPYSMFGVSLSIPLFQGGKRYYEQKKSEISLREMAWQRDNLERALKTQVQIQYDNLQKSVKQINSSEANVDQANKANDIIQKSFRIGAASYLDLRDSENALMAARLSYYQSIYNYLVAQSDLKYVLGSTDMTQYGVQPYEQEKLKK